jgi:hypothetical protein
MEVSPNHPNIEFLATTTSSDTQDVDDIRGRLPREFREAVFEDGRPSTGGESDVGAGRASCCTVCEANGC